MRKFLFILFSLATINSFANKKEHQHEKKHKHQHSAHVHGAAILNIAFDQLNGKIEFETAAEGILGFEHQAKTENEIAILEQSKKYIADHISQLIQFDPKSNCTFKQVQLGIKSQHAADSDHKNEKHKGQHSDFIFDYEVTCLQTLKKTQVQFDFTYFKKLHKIDITVLVDDLQKSVKMSNKITKLDIQ